LFDLFSFLDQKAISYQLAATIPEIYLWKKQISLKRTAKDVFIPDPRQSNGIVRFGVS
jgi:hypothetical protein